MPTNYNDSKMQAIALFKAGNLVSARLICEDLLTENVMDADLWGLIATILTHKRDISAAAEAARKSVELAPDYAHGYSILGWAEQEMQNHVVALRYFRCALELQPTLVNALFLSGRSLLALNKQKQAMEKYEAVLRLQPSNVDAMCALASIHEGINEYDKATAILDKAIAASPSHATANYARAIQRRRCGDLDGARVQLENTLQGEIPDHFRANVFNELGLVLDQLGCFDEAFYAFATSQHISESTYHGQFDGKDTYSGLARRYQLLTSPEYISCTSAEPDDGLPNPIFLVGFPRSGTTLTEQILAAHSRFISSGEAPLLTETIKSIPEIVGHEANYPECIDCLSSDEITALRKRYWDIASAICEYKEGTRFIDKLPLNLLDVAFIHRIFPKAHIVYVQRDPRDVCLSCFFQLFKLNQAMSQFTKLESTVRFYCETMNLWQLYREKLTLDYFEVRYESLVEDMEFESRNLISYLGEPWEKSILDFHADSSKRYITTPSARDVSKPVYSRAVGRWKNYQGKMAMLLDDLEHYVQLFGYRGKSSP